MLNLNEQNDSYMKDIMYAIELKNFKNKHMSNEAIVDMEREITKIRFKSLHDYAIIEWFNKVKKIKIPNIINEVRDNRFSLLKHNPISIEISNEVITEDHVNFDIKNNNGIRNEASMKNIQTTPFNIISTFNLFFINDYMTVEEDKLILIMKDGSIKIIDTTKSIFTNDTKFSKLENTKEMKFRYSIFGYLRKNNIDINDIEFILEYCSRTRTVSHNKDDVEDCQELHITFMNNGQIDTINCSTLPGFSKIEKEMLKLKKLQEYCKELFY